MYRICSKAGNCRRWTTEEICRKELEGLQKSYPDAGYHIEHQETTFGSTGITVMGFIWVLFVLVMVLMQEGKIPVPSYLQSHMGKSSFSTLHLDSKKINSAKNITNAEKSSTLVRTKH